MRPADYGHARAQFSLGFLLEYGLGIKKDEAQAVKYYQESANQGLASAQNNLAYMAQQGRIWREGYYVGKFGEYTMHAVRNRAGTTQPR